MQFGLFYEHQMPRPWHEEDEYQLLQEALEQVELADRLGIDFVWEVEHHFLEEYSHSSAPEVFLAACSQRTKHIRLGHGIVLMPPPTAIQLVWQNTLLLSTSLVVVGLNGERVHRVPGLSWKASTSTPWKSTPCGQKRCACRSGRSQAVDR